MQRLFRFDSALESTFDPFGMTGTAVIGRLDLPFGVFRVFAFVAHSACFAESAMR
jgi:hypothetical protein